MSDPILSISRRYQSALRSHLKAGNRSSLKAARGLGARALSAGLTTLDLARLHEETLVREIHGGDNPSRRAVLIRQAAVFFAAVVSPPEEAHRDGRGDSVQLNGIIEALSLRSAELAAANGDLNREIALRKTVEEALKKSEKHYSVLLAQSDHLQEELRRLSRQILSAQEEERKRISRELHDVIAQTLTGINLRLASLKQEASTNIQGLNENIERTQRLVEQSVDIVHRFARELRPAVLDDLGLVPALRSYLKQFGVRTGIRTRFVSGGPLDSLDTTQRTALYRVAQEALTNTERHARARGVSVTFRKHGNQLCLKVADDGKSFAMHRVMLARGRRGLGLLGMRERVEMVGGKLEIQSRSGSGTTVSACIPMLLKETNKKSARARKGLYSLR
jgi:signal transduction histidine kinase